MTAAEFHEPPARQIEKGYRQNPHCVNERQTVSIPNRPLRVIGDDGGMPDRLMKSYRGQDGDDVNDIQVQHILEERHPAKHQQNATQATRCFDAVKQSERDKRRPERHKQIVKRGRILQRVEE